MEEEAACRCHISHKIDAIVSFVLTQLQVILAITGTVKWWIL